MQKIVECVPNFSEGRREEVVNAIISEIKSVEGAKLLDYSTDTSHNRMVVTIIGHPEAVKNSVYKGIVKATELIDMEKHTGEHPRIGATDVVPFIPIRNMDIKECVELTYKLGQEVWENLKVPVYFYEEAAKLPYRKDLAKVRKGQYEGLKKDITHPERHPDLGEAELHKTAGAVVIGARRPLVAYNVNLASADMGIAKKIADAVRAKTGGMTCIKAIPVKLEQDQTQVSMNLVNYKKNSVWQAFELVKMEAERYGISVVKSEIIGLLPLEAVLQVAEYYLQLDSLPASQVIETNLGEE